MWLLLASLGEAHALGVGSTIAFGPGFDLFGGPAFVPTVDLVFDPVIVQIHALDTLDAAFDEQLYLGANLYVEVVSQPIGGKWEGVVQPGGGLDLFGDPTTVVIDGQVRLGAQAAEQAGVGLYVVPALGLVASDGDSSLFASGALQLSVWFGG
ncbi:MAG: hypothetical protein ABMA64_36520 [Myxococcota bacterium]